MIIYFVRTLSYLLQALPVRSAIAVGRVGGWIAYQIVRKRRVAYVNLKAAFGNRYTAAERVKLVRSVFLNMGQSVVEMLRLPKLGQKYMEEHITFDHLDRYRQAVGEKKGSVLLTSHFGNWEFMQVISGHLGTPLYVLARKQKNGKLDDFLNELRSDQGSVTVFKGGGIRDLIRALRDGKTVGVLGDLSGGKAGTMVRFFGRKTTAPSGIFEIVHRTGSVILPCFIVRREGPDHTIFFENWFDLINGKDGECDRGKTVERYYQLLEKWIERYPDHWFWVYKRWKYCFTKRIVVLRDDKAGHAAQADAIGNQFKQLKEEIAKGFEFEIRTVHVKFKSDLHRRLLSAIGFLAIPFIQGRLSFLRFFLDQSSAQELEGLHADIIVSAGSGLTPVNLFLKQENLAKSVIAMKPSFPYHYRMFDLLIVPMHDQLSKRVTNAVRTTVAPNQSDESMLLSAAESLRKQARIDTGQKRLISIFIGGNTKSYRLDLSKISQWAKAMKLSAQELGFELLVTTSRRTDGETSKVLKEELCDHPLCKLLIIANEANIENATYGMLGLSEVAVVTEDSVSMISEAVSAGKKVIVLQVGTGSLPKKHYRFQGMLLSSRLIETADPTSFASKLASLRERSSDLFRQEEVERIQEALRSLL